MRKQTTEKIKRGDYSFEKTGDDYPKNAPNCHFFKVGVDGQKECGPFGENSENKACCSRREEIIIDYKLCCTKHEGGDPDRYWHCRMRLSKSGNMSDENRLKLREMELRKVGIKTSGKILERVSTVRWWNKPWIIIVGLLGVIATIIALWWGFWVYHNPPSPEEVISDPELGISNIFIDYFDENTLKIDGLDINSEVNLDEVDSLLIYFKLKNIGDPTLVFTVNKILIKTSNGGLIGDHTLENLESKILSKNIGYILHYTRGIKASFILNQLEQDNKFTITIEPDIVYSRKDNLGESKRFDNIIQCNNSLDKKFLPRFKPACHIAYSLE